MKKVKAIATIVVLLVLVGVAVFNLGLGLTQGRVYVGRRGASGGWINAEHPNFTNYMAYCAVAVPVLLGLGYWRFRPSSDVWK